MSRRGEPRAPAALRCHELYLHPPRDLDIRASRRPSASAAWCGALPEPVDVILIHAPALEALSWTRDAGLRPDLVYIDPPYASHRDYVFTQKHPADGSKVARVAFGDRWDGGMDAYVDMLRPIIQNIEGTLSDQGSFLLHVDPRGAPYLSILCDQIFGMGERLPEKNAPGFRNELIWSYGLGGSSPTSWPRKHDNIYWYSKDSRWYFDPPMTPATSQRMRGQMKKQPDVLAIPTINNMAKDRTGYPTQKPTELLQMLVGAHTPVDALVMDVFSGSGTTALAAFLTGRRAIAADMSDDAIAVARMRLVEAGARVAVFRPTTHRSRAVTLDETAIVFEHEGILDADQRFVAAPGQIPTHRISRDVEGNESIFALEHA